MRSACSRSCTTTARRNRWPRATRKHLFAIWGSAPNDMYAVGNTGEIIRFDGAAWSVVTNGSSRQNLRAVWGTSGRLFVAGWSGTVAREAGGQWSTLVTARLFGAWLSTDGAVYAVGLGGLVMRREGQSWSTMSTPPANVSTA